MPLQDAADELGVPPTTLRYWARHGLVAARKERPTLSAREQWIISRPEVERIRREQD